MRPEALRSENVEPCDRTDLPESADMHCPCGFEAGEHPAWRRRYCRNRRYPEHGAVSPCVLCGYISPTAPPTLLPPSPTDGSTRERP